VGVMTATQDVADNMQPKISLFFRRLYETDTDVSFRRLGFA